jgi:hypothetical protein
MAEEAQKPSGGGLQRVVLWFVILCLLGAVWWLASERNEHHFRIAVVNGHVVVERGRFFPTGTAPVGADDKVYGPIAVPAGEKPPSELEFEGQNQLDRYLFDLLAGWAKSAAKKGDTHTAAALVDRASQLPGLTGGQVTELAALKEDLVWDEAQADLRQAADVLDAVSRKLQVVGRSKGPHAGEASSNAAAVQDFARQLRAMGPPPAPPPAPAAAPPAAPPPK